MELIRNFSQLGKNDVSLAGGKGASLGEMLNTGLPVPPGFVILSTAFEQFLKDTDLDVEIDSILHTVQHQEMHTVEHASEKIQKLILEAKMPKNIEKEIKKEFKKLNAKYVAVRSSATAEDSDSAAWAGQLDTYLNTEEKTLLPNVQKCWASLFTPRAIFYRFEKQLHNQKISVAVVIQKMIESEKSGIAFSVHPVTEDRNQIIIEAGFGLGESIVSGQITPDSYVVEKNPKRIIDKNISEQTKSLIRANKGSGNQWVIVPYSQQKKQVLSDKEILELSELVLKIENHYQTPQDIEWAFEKGGFYIVQSRPITTLKQIITQQKKSGIGLNLSEWEFEFQQRDDHPLIMADQWCKSLYNNFAQEINLDVKPYDYMFTGTYRGYVKTKQKKDLLKKFFETAEDQKYLDYVFERTIGRVKELVDFSITVRGNLPNTNKDLLKIWRNFNALFLKVIPWFWIPYYLSEKDFLTNKVKEGLKKYTSAISKITDMNNALGLLCFPIKNNKLQDEQKALYELVRFSKENKNYRSDAKFNNLVNSYLENFAWTKTFKELPKEPLNHNELLQKISDSINLDFVEQFELQKKQKEKNQKIVERILKIVKKDKALLKCIENARHLGWMLSASVEDSLMALANLIPFYKKIAKTINVSYEDWVHFTVDEIEGLLDGKALNVSLDDRRMSYVYIMEGGKRKMYFGTIAKQYTDEIDTALTKVDTNISEFSGNPTSPGIVRGKVRIAINPDESKNVLDGDILVCGMTSPDYVPAMKRAAAIITDEGGLLSHAAIISREFGKPCVVGTKVGTQVLHDGDLVEVDADKGVVKILERASNNKKSQVVRSRSVATLDNKSKTTEHSKFLFIDFLKHNKSRYVGFYNNASFQAWFWAGWYQESIAKKIGYQISLPIFFSFRGGHACAVEQIYTETALFLKDKVVKKDKAYFARLVKCLDAEAQKAFKTIEKIKKEKRGLSDPKVFAEFLSAGQRLEFFWAMGYYCAMSFEQQIRNAAKQTGIPEEMISNYINILPTPLLKRQKEVRNLRSLLEKNLLTANSVAEIENSIRTNSKLLTVFEDHLTRYQWVGYTMFVGKPMTLRGLISEVLKAVKVSDMPHKIISSRHPFAIYSDIAAKLLYLNQAGGEYFSMFGEKSVPILTRLAKKARLSLDELLRIMPSEIYDGSKINTDIKTKAIRRRNDEQCIYLDQQGKVSITEDLAEVAAIASIMIPNPSLFQNKNTIIGFTGNRGFARGIVRVIRHVKEFHKMQDNDILVAGMTTPDFTPLMQRSAAIITDGGGLLCHAVIVSREMNKPCIIGTKFATQVLKDGDLVEVDADKGVVKILKRAKDESKATEDNAQKLFHTTKWEHYLTRPFTLFGASLWQEWYGSEVAHKLFGVQMKSTLFVEQAPCVARNYRIKGELAHFKNGIKKILKKDEKKARALMDEAVVLNVEAKKYILGKKKFYDLPQAVNFLVNIALRATILPFWVIHFSKTINYRDERLVSLAEKLRGVSLYPDLVSKVITPLAEKVLKQKGGNKKHLHLLTLSELLRGDVISLEKRKGDEKGRVFLYEVFDGKERISFVDNSFSVIAKLEHITHTSQEIRGQVAYKGRVRGSARIVYGMKKDIVFNEGDILVSINSNPSLMPFIKKCGGIVTDEGGIMCHAAIVARELKKPCIIGTRFATSFIKDGDIIEVDADKGIVKIISN